MRLDVYLTEKKLCRSRTAAQELIKSGGVCIGGKICRKPSAEVSGGEKISVVGEQPRYVGRGGLKLEGALNAFGIRLDGKICLDIGASTGGFTDCMLRHGAAAVYAVDVGRGQLSPLLRDDSRVISFEQTDVRSFSFEEGMAADFIGTDVSFISLKLILPHIMRLLKSGGEAVALIKPQFEVGQSLCADRSALSKNGIVRSESVRRKIVGEITEYALQCGFSVTGTADSPITGGDGNVEYLIALRKKEDA